MASRREAKRLSSSGVCMEDAVGYGAADLRFGPVGVALPETEGEESAHGGVHPEGLFET
jgi:hypothetical protein